MRNPVRGLFFGLMFSAVLWGAGCATYMRAYVAVHDAVDAVLADKTNSPALPPSLPADKPATGDTDLFRGGTEKVCGCDLTSPVADQFTGAYLASRGNLEEAPSTRYGFRLQLRRGSGRDWNVGSLIPKATDDLGERTVRANCFDHDGFRYHLLGATKLEKHDPEIPLKFGDTIKHDAKRVWLVYESRKHK